MEFTALLTLPTTSPGLGSLRSTIAESTTGSASPRRKIARLDTDSDITSSSSRSTVSKSAQTKGPIVIRVHTDDNAPRRTELDLAKERNVQMNDLRRCITQILDEKNTTTNPLTYTTCEKAYSLCRSLVVVHDAGSELYDGFRQRVGEAILRINKELRTANGEKEAEDWIALLVHYCKWFRGRVDLLRSILTYLDQVYVVKHSSTRVSLREQAFGVFATDVLDHIDIKEYLDTAVKTWLTWEREHRTAAEKRSVIPALVEQLTIHGLFASFETYYIDCTQEYYREEARVNAQENDAMGFFRDVQARIQEEVERAKAVLPVGSWAAVQTVTETALLDTRVEWLSQSILPALMDANNTQVIGEMYTLFGRVDGLKPLQKAFRDYVQKAVENIVKDTARDEEMVPRLLELKSQVENTISKAFLVSDCPTAQKGSTSTPPKPQSDPNFVNAMNDAFTLGFRARRNKPAEMIARYLHQQLRKGQKGLSDEEFEKVLEAALALYRFSDDKDVFRTFYHRSLAKRLLSGSSASDDFEANMLKKLKEKYDPEFGMGEDMFKDLKLSKDLMSAYHSILPPGDSALKLNVTVLQRSAWPFGVPKTVVDLPPKMQEDLTKFADYYKSKHSGRVLDWDHSLGTAVLKSRFNKGVKDLDLNLHQALVLLLFNGEDEIPFRDIRDRLRMEDGELRRTLQSLACGKKKVLKKLPAGKDVGDDDVFRFNADFWDERARVHISSIQEKITPEESQKTNEAIEGDRKHYLDAAIVRIMKGKKEMSYEKLKAATIDAVKNHFVPSVDVIKKRIDSLVEGEYLRRSEEDRHYFHYVA
ncbi:hypothetical protein NMY22_g1674 [Coprinellus aureogranulatus]|nr:hypothetical protein NMY22_g1674 [Coprinellus aureogranulatus]